MKDSVNHGMDLYLQSNSIRSSISMNTHKITIEVIKPPWAPTTIWRISEAIFNELEERCSPYTIKTYVKKVLRYNFKKGWSRPPKYCQPNTKIAEELFWNELLRMIHNKQTIFSVDEWSFSRAMKMEYNWFPICKSSSIVNNIWKGSASLVLSVGSNSQWFWVIKIGTVDSKVFNISLALLEKVLLKTKRNSRSVPVVSLTMPECILRITQRQ